MAYLTRDQILGARDLKHHDEVVPEWPDAFGHPGTICLVEFSAGEMSAFLKSMGGDPAGDDGMYRVLVHAAVNDPVERQRIFTDEDIEILKGKSLTVLDRLQRIALRINRLLPGAVVEVREELKKDLSEAASGGSPSSLPSPSVE